MASNWKYYCGYKGVQLASNRGRVISLQTAIKIRTHLQIKGNRYDDSCASKFQLPHWTKKTKKKHIAHTQVAMRQCFFFDINNFMTYNSIIAKLITKPPHLPCVQGLAKHEQSYVARDCMEFATLCFSHVEKAPTGESAMQLYIFQHCK